MGVCDHLYKPTQSLILI